MTLTATAPTVTSGSYVARHHSICMWLFCAIVIGHWAEHLVQAFQIYALGWDRPDAGGILGLYFPWLVTSEVMHYGFAIVMLVGFWVLRHGFTGRARQWWMLAFAIQFWHHIEHFLLLSQAMLGQNLAGSPVPMSVLQFFLPRVELHLFYNAIVTIPMVVAMVIHLRENSPEPHSENRSALEKSA